MDHNIFFYDLISKRESERVSKSVVQFIFQIIPILFRSPFRLLDFTDPFQMSSLYFRLYRSFSELQSVFQIIPILFRSSVRLLDYTRSFSEVQYVLYYTDPFQKSSLSYIIPILFRSPVRLLDYTDPFQKSSSSFILYRSFSKVQSVFLAHLAKGNVSFCHHLASVVHHLSSVNFSHFNLLL